MNSEQAAQAQLDAYNARDIEAFLKPYDESIELARLPGGEVFARGHAEVRAIYPWFEFRRIVPPHTPAKC